MTPSSPTASSATPSATLERVISLIGGGLLLVPILRRRSPWRWGVAAAGGALLYNGLSDTVYSAESSTMDQASFQESITIGRSADVLSSMWRSPDVILRVMQPFGDLQILGTDHFRWRASALGKNVEVECSLAKEQSGELVRWTSIPTSALKVDQQMRFKPAPDGRGTEATLILHLDLSALPAGRVLQGISSFLEGAARLAIRKVLHNFRSLAETGEIPTLERNPSARANTNGKWNGDLI